MPLKRWRTLSLLIALLLSALFVNGRQCRISLHAEAGILVSIGPISFKNVDNGLGIHHMPYRLPLMRLRLGADYALDPHLSIGIQAGINQVYLEQRLGTYYNMTFFPVTGKIDYSFYRKGVHTFFVSAAGGLHILRLSGEGNRGGWLYTLAIGKRRPISKRMEFFYKAGFEHHAHKFWIRDRDEILQLQETPHTNMILAGMGFSFR